MAVVVQKLDAPTVRSVIDERYSPLFRCEECGREIAKPVDGRVAWRPEENATYRDVAFLHEGCVDAYRSRHEVRLRVHGLSSYVDSVRRFMPEEAE